MALSHRSYSFDLLFQLHPGLEHELEHIRPQINACASLTNRYVQQISGAKAQDVKEVAHSHLPEWGKHQSEIDKCLRYLVPDLQHKPPYGSRGRTSDQCIIAGLRCFIAMAIVQAERARLGHHEHLHCRSDLSTLHHWHKKLSDCSLSPVDETHLDDQEYLAMLVPVSIKSDMIVYIHLKRHESRSGKDRSAVRRSYKQVSVDSSSWHEFAEELSAVQRPGIVPSWHMFLDVSHVDARDWATVVKRLSALNQLIDMHSLAGSVGKGSSSLSLDSKSQNDHRSAAQGIERSVRKILRQCTYGTHAEKTAEPFKAFFEGYIEFLTVMAKVDSFSSRFMRELGLSRGMLTTTLNHQRIVTVPYPWLAFEVDLVYLVSSGLRSKIDLGPDLSILRCREPHDYELVRKIVHFSTGSENLLEQLQQNKPERDGEIRRGRPFGGADQEVLITQYGQIERRLFNMMDLFTVADQESSQIHSSAEMTAHVEMVYQLQRAVSHVIDATKMLSQPLLAPRYSSAFLTSHVPSATLSVGTGAVSAQVRSVVDRGQYPASSVTPHHEPLKHRTYDLKIVAMIRDIRRTTKYSKHAMTRENQLSEIMKKYTITEHTRDPSVVNLRDGRKRRDTFA